MTSRARFPPDLFYTPSSAFIVFIFFTYLYYTTAACIDIVGKKSILIPTMHDEPSAYLPIFKNVMAAPKFIFFNTVSEKIFSEKMFSIHHVQKEIVAVGIDEDNINDEINIKDRFGINKKYILYLGRIDSAKGCNELFDNFIEFKKKDQHDIILVLAGKNMIKEVKHSSIRYLGFVSDIEKTQLIKSALSIVVPSKYESLSLVLLESFIYNVPVIANGNCQVLLDHIENSEGGWVYFNPKEFNSAILSSLDEIENRKKGKKGYEYVKRNYTWDKVMQKFHHAISLIESQPY